MIQLRPKEHSRNRASSFHLTLLKQLKLACKQECTNLRETDCPQPQLNSDDQEKMSVELVTRFSNSVHSLTSTSAPSKYHWKTWDDVAPNIHQHVSVSSSSRFQIQVAFAKLASHAQSSHSASLQHRRVS